MKSSVFKAMAVRYVFHSILRFNVCIGYDVDVGQNDSNVKISIDFYTVFVDVINRI